MHHEKTKIYSFYYRPDNVLQLSDMYVSLWAGKNKSKKTEGFTGDDTGDNISDKNKFYSELTGLYWVWKNTKSDIIGSCHYRRYFTVNEESSFYKVKRLLFYAVGLWRKRFGLIYTQNIKLWKPKIISETEVTQLLSEFEAILPIRRKLKYSVREHYERYHNIEDFNLIEQILKEQYPEYMHSYYKLMDNNRLFANNMFILKWETFDSMMNWLFTILFEFEKQIDINTYTGYQERIFGFLSERLITLWILHNNIKYKELPLIYFKKLKPDSSA